MSRWTQNLIFFLLCAANAMPLLARQSGEYPGFPKTLEEAIDPDIGFKKIRTTMTEKRSTGNKLSTNSRPRLRSTSPGSGINRFSNDPGSRRPIPSKKVSSHRILDDRVAPSRTGSNVKFEFGTVMMFPANDRRQNSAGVSGIYRAPSKSARSHTGNDPPLAQISSSELVDGKSVLSISVNGPQDLTSGTPDEFAIEIANTSLQPATNIIVQLTTPDGITISKLHRRAWLDEIKRTVSWKVKEIPAGEKVSIRYDAVSGVPGPHRQRITIGMEDVFQGETAFETIVSTSKEQEINPRTKPK